MRNRRARARLLAATVAGALCVALIPALAAQASTPPAPNPASQQAPQVTETARAADATKDARAKKRKKRARGLTVSVAAVPKGARAKVTVRGPGGFRTTIRKTKKWKRATPGVYRVSAAKDTFKRGTAYPTVTKKKVRVRKARGAKVTVSYRNVVAKKTRVVKAKKVRKVTGAVTGQRKVVVRGGTKFRKGQVVAAGVSKATPEGLLAKVTDVKRKSGTSTYTVVPATLPEAIPSATFSKAITANLGTLTGGSGVTALRGDDPTTRRTVGRNRGTVSCSATPFTVERTVSGDIGVRFAASWNGGNATVRATAYGDASAAISASLGAGASCTIADQQIGKTVWLRPIVFSIGPVPVVITPTLRFYGSAVASASAKAAASVGLRATASAWIEGSVRGGVSSGSEPPRVSGTKSFSIPESVNGRIAATLSAQLTTEVYGLAGPYVKVRIGPSINLQTFDPWLKMQGNLAVDAGVVLDKCVGLWGAKACATLDASKKNLINKTWTIYEQRYSPEEGNLGSGDVQFTLRWDNNDDYDLHVYDPWGEEIYFGQRTSSSGGQLDRDEIPGCGSPTSGNDSAENIYWPQGGSPSGNYVVWVDEYNDCTSANATWTLTVRVGGIVKLRRTGTGSSGYFSVNVA
jgi:hypothetical protein